MTDHSVYLVGYAASNLAGSAGNPCGLTTVEAAHYRNCRKELLQEWDQT